MTGKVCRAFWGQLNRIDHLELPLRAKSSRLCCNSIILKRFAFWNVWHWKQFELQFACQKRPQHGELDDGWPESVEEQGLLLLVLRHYITRKYIKDKLETDETSSVETIYIYILQIQYTSLHRILRIVFHTRKTFYTQTLLHTEAFTHTHKLLHTETSTLHTDAFTHRRFYTQRLLHTDAFTHTHTRQEWIIIWSGRNWILKHANQPRSLARFRMHKLQIVATVKE